MADRHDRSAQSAPEVLVVDDEPRILRMIKLTLTSHGFRVIAAQDAERALAAFASRPPGAVVLDLVLDGMRRVDVLSEMKQRSTVPVVVLTADSSERARIEAMSHGADDFVGKPFDPERLVASLKSLLGHEDGTESPARAIRSAGGVEIDLGRESVQRAGARVELTRSEWLLIKELALHAGEPRLYQELLTAVWGPEYRNDLDFLRLWIQKLSRKLSGRQGSPSPIRQYLDVGYVLSVTTGPRRVSAG